MRAFLLLVAACGVAGFNTGVTPRAALVRPRVAAPTMQFFNPKKDVRKKKDGTPFYDDEKPIANRNYNPDYAENGEVDLANVGGELYLAFVPFLLFFFAYSFGLFNFGYSNGNF